jgi:hypothetical protein
MFAVRGSALTQRRSKASGAAERADDRGGFEGQTQAERGHQREARRERSGNRPDRIRGVDAGRVTGDGRVAAFAPRGAGGAKRASRRQRQRKRCAERQRHRQQQQGSAKRLGHYHLREGGARIGHLPGHEQRHASRRQPGGAACRHRRRHEHR